jgi:hypothetical protein
MKTEGFAPTPPVRRKLARAVTKPRIKSCSSSRDPPLILVEFPPLPFRFDNRVIDRDFAGTVWLYPQRTSLGRSFLRQEMTYKVLAGLLVRSG